MSYLIDTNVLSELRRKQPDPAVVAWMQARPRASLYLSVLTLGEIRKGIERVEDTRRKQLLLDWLEVELPNYFVGRLLPVDTHTADRWGRLMASAGRPLPAIDSLLAATALQHDLTLVTRNTKDFEGLGVQLVNPLVDLLRSRELAQPTEALFSQGDTVLITEGPFAGLEAAYQMADAEQRAMVLLHLLSQPVQVKIDTASLRKVS